MKTEISSSQQVPIEPGNKRPLYEMLVIFTLMIVSVLFIPILQHIMALVPIVYFLVESKIRKRAHSEIGFRPHEFLNGIKKSWLLVLLVVIVSQVLYLIVAKTMLPELIVHLKERTPINLQQLDSKLMLSLIILPLGEEIAFRGLIQKRLNWIMSTPMAIILSSLLFALMHFAPGNPVLVATDLTSVFVDSVLFGLIYAKTKNLLVSWAAHSLADIAGVLLVAVLF